jgi:hypothetical protein
MKKPEIALIFRLFSFQPKAGRNGPLDHFEPILIDMPYGPFI